MAPTPFHRHLALLGTGSDVGKSLLCAAVGRLLAQQGHRVAPFKAQNMSNNAYVTADGGEIGRAQYVQALACGVEPSVHHNPVLLKPTADQRSQVVVRGCAIGSSDARSYFRDTSALREKAFESFDLVAGSCDTVILEGAGSCAEVNLRSRDFVNFEAAHHANARVVLVADIDRGGVFAQIVGSLAVISPEDRARVCGVIINKFRGDRRLFDDGVTYLEQRTGVPILGVVPFLYGLDLDAEDAVPISTVVDPPQGADAESTRVGVIRLPHISNFTDFDALARVEGLAVHYLYRPRTLTDYDVVILPGSKSVIADLQWMRETGVADKLIERHRMGGRVLGICGGYQMLGRQIADPTGVEGVVGTSAGLGILPVSTTLEPDKIVRQTGAHVLPGGEAVHGYEIHCGRSEVHGSPPLLRLHDGSSDGLRLDTVWGTYLHGLFDDLQFRRTFLEWIAPARTHVDDGRSRRDWLDAELDRFASHVRDHVDWSRVVDWTSNPACAASSRP